MLIYSHLYRYMFFIFNNNKERLTSHGFSNSLNRFISSEGNSELLITRYKIHFYPKHVSVLHMVLPNCYVSIATKLPYLNEFLKRLNFEMCLTFLNEFAQGLLNSSGRKRSMDCKIHLTYALTGALNVPNSLILIISNLLMIHMTHAR